MLPVVCLGERGGERGEGGEGGEGGRSIGAGGRGGRGGRGIGTGGTGGAAGALEMLAVWWQLYHGKYGLEHAFEQHALHWQLLAEVRSQRGGGLCRMGAICECYMPCHRLL